MDRNNDQKDIKRREAEARGIPPPPRRNSGLKTSSGSTPSFRFAQMDVGSPSSSSFMAPSPGFPFATPGAAARPDVNAQLDEDVIDGPTKSVATMSFKPFPIAKEHFPKQQYFQTPIIDRASDRATVPVWDSKRSAKRPSDWCCDFPSLNKLPKYFPLERTNRPIQLEDCSFDELLKRLVEGFRIMSIQAKFFNRPASAALLTPENVELYLALWQSDDSKAVIVEVQRRRGDGILFHQYASHILDAASGNLDENLFTNQTEKSLLYLKSTEQMLRSQLSRVAPDRDMDKEFVVALEIVTELLKKDRRDARQLGMEGVCILANARKTALSAAILTSRNILLRDQSSTQQGLFEILLGIIQKRSIDGQDEDMGGDYHEDSDDEQYFLDDNEEIRDYSPEYKEEITLLFNLALDAVSHALEVVTNFGIDAKLSPAESPVTIPWVIDSFLLSAGELFHAELLTTFLQTLQQAWLKPHNAWLAAKCLRFICSASPSAKERTRALGGMQCVDAALTVGCSSHAKLESECYMLKSVLTC